MRRESFRRAAVACVGVMVGILLLTPAARADPPKMVIGDRHPTSRQEHAPKSRATSSSGSGGMWIGSAGVALALAAFGGLSLAAKKGRIGGDAGPLKVVGRTALSPKQTVYLLRAGDRVLIVGAGGQGAPSLLGELTDAATLDRLAPKSDRRIGGQS